MTSMSLERWLPAALLAVAVVGFVFVGWELYPLERSLRSGAQAAVYQQASDLRACLVGRPEARAHLSERDANCSTVLHRVVREG